MKTCRHLSKIIAVAILSFALADCSKDKSPTDDNNASQAFEFWDNGQYLQHHLSKKVKTIRKTSSDETGEYRLTEYNAKGYITKDFHYDENGITSGTTYYYDEKNRTVKIVEGTADEPEDIITEFAYDGRHQKYLPTNFVIDDIRLQRGLTRMSIKTGDDKPAVVELQSATNNQLVFKTNLGDDEMLTDQFGSSELVIIIDYSGDMPVAIKIRNTNNQSTDIVLKYFEDGKLSEVTYHVPPQLFAYDMITKFIKNATFQLIESEKVTREETELNEYQYNDQEDEILNKCNGVDDNRYSYEYDNAGNWTKRSGEYYYGGKWRPKETVNRVFTYW